MFMKKEFAVIFDMDGVIFDSERAYIECMEEVADMHGLENMHEVALQCIGRNEQSTKQILMEAYGEDFAYDEYRKQSSDIFHSRYDNGRLPLKPYVNDIFEELEKMEVPIALASSTRKASVIQELSDSGLLHYFDELVCGDMVEKSKPSPDIFLKACEMLGVSPENAYVIEDSYNGIRAAFDAGTHPIMVPDIIAPDDEMRQKAEIILPDLERALEYLKMPVKNKTGRLLCSIEAVARECGNVILNADRDTNVITSKEGHANFVTKYDKKVQDILEDKLLKLLPEAVFVGEEGENNEILSSGYAFIVDPIDGTTNFIKDYHASAISIGLLKDGHPFLGVVYNPYLDEMFTAVSGYGSYCNGEKIHVSDKDLSNGIVLFGTAPYYEELSRKSFDVAYDYFKRSMDIRRSGSAALDLCSIAAGRAELYFELILQPWDYAAGLLIVKEAGGKVTTFEGQEVCFDKPCSVLATNGIAG